MTRDMHKLTKSLIANYLSFYLVSNYLLTSFAIHNGIIGYTKIALFMAVIFPLLKPIFKIVLFPLNLLTLGLLDLFIDVIIIYLLTLLVPELTVSGQSFAGASYGNLKLGAFYLNRFWVMFLASTFYGGIYKIFRWLMQ